MLGKLVQGEVEEDLRRVERVHASGAPFRIRQQRLEAAAEHEEPLPHDGDGHRIDQIPVEHTESACRHCFSAAATRTLAVKRSSTTMSKRNFSNAPRFMASVAPTPV